MDDNLLSTEQVLLLENLTYLQDNEALQSLKTIEENKGSDIEFTVGYVVEQLS